MFQLTQAEHEGEKLPTAYIDLVESRAPADSARQVVVELSELDFNPRELIFDLDKDNRVIGVELLG